MFQSEYRACACGDCERVLMTRFYGFLGSGGGDYEWFWVKDRVWHEATRGDGTRFLCVGCLEKRIKRKLEVSDFKRSREDELRSKRIGPIEPSHAWAEASAASDRDDVHMVKR